MKRHIKNTKNNIIAITGSIMLVVSLVPASIVSAQDLDQSTGGYCATVNLDKLEQKLVTVELKHEAGLEKLDTKIAHKNETGDKKHAKGFNKLEKKWGNNPAAKALVDQYKAAVQDAIKTHPIANEAALAIFKTAVGDLEATRKASIETALKALKTSCATGVAADHQTAGKTFKDAVKTANKTFHDARKTALATMKGSSGDNGAAFRAVIDAANKTLKDGMKALKDSRK